MGRPTHERNSLKGILIWNTWLTEAQQIKKRLPELELVGRKFCHMLSGKDSWVEREPKRGAAYLLPPGLPFCTHRALWLPDLMLIHS